MRFHKELKRGLLALGLLLVIGSATLVALATSGPPAADRLRPALAKKP
jgi:hypothetical protein